MFNENNIELLERHFANELTQAEQEEFNKLISDDANFEELVGYFDDFMVGMEDFGDKAIMLELKALEKVIQKEELEASKPESSSLQNLLKGFLDKADYTLEQLAALFQPVPNYQPLLAYTHRGDNIPLEKPKEVWDLGDADIQLKFKTATPMDLSLLIENNQRQTVWNTIIPKNSHEFVVSLENTAINSPGRYYIKLSDGKETMMLEFFVRRDWM